MDSSPHTPQTRWMMVRDTIAAGFRAPYSATLKVYEAGFDDEDARHARWHMFPPDEMINLHLGPGEYVIARNSQGWMTVHSRSDGRRFIRAAETYVNGAQDYPNGVTIRIDDPYRLNVSMAAEEFIALDLILRALDSGYPTAAVETAEFNGSSVFIIPGSWLIKQVRDLIIDQETGLLVGIRGADGSIIAELVDFEAGIEPDTSLFVPEGTIMDSEEVTANCAAANGLTSLSRVNVERETLRVYSDRAELAWQVDRKTGKIEEILYTAHDLGEPEANDGAGDCRESPHPKGGVIVGCQQWQEDPENGERGWLRNRVYWKRPHSSQDLLVDASAGPDDRPPQPAVAGDRIAVFSTEAVSLFSEDMELQQRIPYQGQWASTVGDWFVSVTVNRDVSDSADDLAHRWVLDLWDPTTMTIVASAPVNRTCPFIVEDCEQTLWIADGELYRLDQSSEGTWIVTPVISGGVVTGAEALK